MHRALFVATACAGLLLQGCSSRPREFKPTLGIATADAAGFDQAYAACTQLMVADKLDRQGRLGSLGGGAAVGATTAAVGAETAAAIGGYAGMAAAVATIRFAPLRDYRRCVGHVQDEARQKRSGHQGRDRLLPAGARLQRCELAYGQAGPHG